MGMKNPCTACGSNVSPQVSMGGALVCRQCEPDIRERMEELREAGKPVNVIQIAKKYFRETHSGGNYLLRDIPEELWRRAKYRAVTDGTSLRDLVLKALYDYIDK